MRCTPHWLAWCCGRRWGPGRATSPLRLLLTGGLLALAALARVDGFALLLVVSLYLAVSTPVGVGVSQRSLLAGRQIALLAVPFLLVLGAYLGAKGISTGSWDVGSATVSYHAFEQAQGMVYNPFSSRGYAEGIPRRARCTARPKRTICRLCRPSPAIQAPFCIG